MPSFCFLNYFGLCRVVFGFYITCDDRIDVELLFVAAAGAAGSPTSRHQSVVFKLVVILE